MSCLLVTALDGVGGGGKDVWPFDGDVDGNCALRALGDRFVEPILPTDRLVIFGAGHIAHALAPLAQSVGFETLVCDEDERFLSEERFPGHQRLHTFEASEVATELAPFGARDFVVIATRDHALDQKLVESLLPRELAYLGLVGSAGKLGRFRKRIEAKGTFDEARWQRLRSPVGLDIHAETPAEIAVSIVAELIRERHAHAHAHAHV